MKILISGASGLVGSSLIPYLTAKGHNIHTLVRSKPTTPSQIQWDPLRQGPTPEALNGFDAVVHLAGESIAAGRWTEARKVFLRAAALPLTGPHGYTAIHNLAATMEQSGKADQAAALYERAYRGRRETLGPEHPATRHSEAAIRRLHKVTFVR